MLVRVHQGGVRLLELDDQVPAVERGHERAHQLTHTPDLVAAEARGEGAREYDQRARARQTGDGDRHHQLFRAAYHRLADAGGKARQMPGKVGHACGVESAARDGRPGGVEEDA